MRILLVATYELGHQPFSLASAGAWLRERGHTVAYVDLSRDPLPYSAVKESEAVCFLLSMHTATQLALGAVEKVRRFNPSAHLVAFGHYAVLNESLLRKLGVAVILGGEVEAELAAAVERLERGEAVPAEAKVSWDRLPLLVPDRRGMPQLGRYSRLHINGETKVVGYTEASRGCKHLCRHCPVVPVYDGRFRVVPREVVLADIRQQVAAGAGHITFGDADFFNGPGHALRVVTEMHAEFPALSYDVTIKISHLLEHRKLLSKLRETGCLFVTSAVESTEDLVLEKLAKGHTRADFLAALAIMRAEGLLLAPTFVPFTPWTSWEGYADLLKVIAEQDLVEQVAPIQLALRLLIPNGSRILTIPGIEAWLTKFDERALIHRWRHADAKVEELSHDLLRLVNELNRRRASRRVAFARIWERVHGRAPVMKEAPARATIPYLDEPWYC